MVEQTSTASQLPKLPRVLPLVSCADGHSTGQRARIRGALMSLALLAGAAGAVMTPVANAQTQAAAGVGVTKEQIKACRDRMDANLALTKGAKLLIAKPKVSMALLTTGGVAEARVDWTQDATKHLSSALVAQVKARGLEPVVQEAEPAADGPAGQTVRLFNAVSSSVSLHETGVLRLPTKACAADWTLGAQAGALAEATGADYALFTSADGRISSGGRVAVAILVGAATGYVPSTGGGNTGNAFLVDLKSGQVLWANPLIFGGDLREETAGAGWAKAMLPAPKVKK